jgi:hypothetical protein
MLGAVVVEVTSRRDHDAVTREGGQAMEKPRTGASRTSVDPVPPGRRLASSGRRR